MDVSMISFLGVVVAIIFLIWSIYRGLGLPLASIAATVIIILTSGQNFSETWNAAMNGGVTMMLGTYAPVYLFGGILGLFYAESGAAASLGEAFLSVSRKVKNPSLRRMAALCLFLIFRIMLTVAGIDGMACIIPTVALCVAMFREFDIPRRFMNAFLITGCTISLFMPFVPCGPNIMIPMFIEGFSAKTGWQARMTCVLLMTVLVVILFNHMVEKVHQKGEEHFEPGKLERFNMPPDMKKPHWLLTLIPIIVVAILYNAFMLDAWIALALGTVLAVVMFGGYIMTMPGKSKFGTVIEKCNQGGMMISLMLAIGMLPGCAISVVPAYGLITEYCTQVVNILPGAIVFAVIAVLLTLIGGSNTIILCMLANAVFIPAGLPLKSIAVLMFIGGSVLSGLPNSMFVCAQAEMTDCTMKESYGPVFTTNVVLPAVLMVMTTILVVIGIW